MTRGVNRRVIFEDSDDYQRYLEIAKDVAELTGVDVLAYALMPNHVHLLAHDPANQLPSFFQRLGTRYAMWFNWRHSRVGHLFQGRFKSLPIDTDAYLAAALTYIHMNPVKGGLADTAATYKWSSASPSAGRFGLADRARLAQFTDLEAAADRLAQAEARGIELTDPFSPRPAGRRRGLSQDDAARALMEAAHVDDAAEFRRLSAPAQERAVERLLALGLPISQAARVTGLTKWAVQQIKARRP
jgi:REP element-mobilizing transposase RayT